MHIVKKSIHTNIRENGMIYDFDAITDRTHSNSVKYDEAEKKFGTKDIIPLWIADMDFPLPDRLSMRWRSGIKTGFSAIRHVPIRILNPSGTGRQKGTGGYSIPPSHLFVRGSYPL